MAENQTAEKTKENGKPASAKAQLSRRNQRKLGRSKRAERLQKDTEWAKAYFDGKSKRSTARKLAWRKRHAKA